MSQSQCGRSPSQARSDEKNGVGEELGDRGGVKLNAFGENKAVQSVDQGNLLIWCAVVARPHGLNVSTLSCRRPAHVLE